MDVRTIRSLHGYNRWANDRLLAAAQEIPPEYTRQTFGASFDTIHGTFAHILAAEIVWLSRWKGTSPTKIRSADDFANLAEIRAYWEQQQRELDAFISELTPERLSTIIRYTNTRGEPFEYPLWQMMMHVVNHGTHHRSELADMLTRVGSPPPPMDMIVYFNEPAQRS